MEIEQLTPRQIVYARIMFRGHTELADNYLSFGYDDIFEVEARRQWFNDKLELVTQLRANRLSTDS